MPFQVVYTTVFKDVNTPSMEDYLGTLSSDVLSDYPVASGKTPTQFFSEHKETVTQKPSTFISEEFHTSDDGLTKVITQVWQDNSEWVDPAHKANVAVDETTTAFRHLNQLFANTYIANTSVTTANI